MRRRGAPADDAGDARPVPRRKALSDALKNLDVYSNHKVAAEFTEKTPASDSRSTALTRTAWILMAVLLLAELRAFLTVTERDHMTVDKSLGEKLRITLNVTFPALNCAELHLDAMDVAGDYHPYMEQHMTKSRLRANGAAIAHDAIDERANVMEHDAAKIVPACDSCFGAESGEFPCCNTCDDLVQAYQAKGWSSSAVVDTAPQCAQDRRHGPFANMVKGEGCNLAGWLEVNKVGGNFHIALGESSVRQGRFVHQFNPADAPLFNVSHIIHHLSFGEVYQGMMLPLNGVSKTVAEGESTGLYQYFIKLVPTSYVGAPGAAPLRTTRYSSTHRFRPLSTRLDAEEAVDHAKHAILHEPTALLPGVFWVYDLSAFTVEVSRHRPPLSHFVVRVCAVVGGVFTLVGGLDQVFQHVVFGK
ncbi:endoplasmic reticulum vesicle transporter-domain-containing protein [Pelagophyceae sp. CCMP2097]|nr:endoplasmic reticulum vesicle transporter-domain-containing protein [Pelagophyceae sp. CCMP2097]